MLVASLVVFHVSPLISLPVWALFCLIDGAYLSANLFKFTNGALALADSALPLNELPSVDRLLLQSTISVNLNGPQVIQHAHS